MQHRLRELYVGSVVAIAASFFAAWLFEVFNNGVHNDVLEGVTILGAAALMLYVSGWLLLRQDPELLAVRTIALPGAAGQIALVSVLGIAVAYALGWSIGGGIVFGLALSVASTAVVLHALQQRRLVETDRGRIAVGWLVVQDLVTALALLLLPAFAGLLGGKPVEQVAIRSSP